MAGPSGYPVSWQRITSVTILLIPLAWLFRICVAIRRWLYRQNILASERLPVPVIVAGNISVGGTGKTPFVLWLAEVLLNAGYRPGIVSRGYGSNSTQVRAVNAMGSAADFGDEPLLLARRSACPVWIGADRARAAGSLLTRHPDCSVIISDDGLQHYRLARDIEVALIDATRGLGNGYTLPAGPLREPESRLATVDFVVCNGTPQPPLVTASQIHEMSLEGGDFHNLHDPAIRIQAARLSHRRIHAIAGIGNPERFFATLRGLGLTFTPHAYADHHAYSADDLVFADCNAVLMTEKDAVKCAAYAAPAGVEYWVLRVDAKLEPALGAQILEKLGRKT